MTDGRASPVHEAILIAGPTGSGKSRLAVELAAHLDGVVINADSMQVYRDLRILTARPSDEEEARVPHRLYGHVPGEEAYSAGRYVREAAVAIGEAHGGGRLPIVVGGTGLYFKALTEGLSPIPDVPREIRIHWRREADRLGARALHEELARRDPAMADRLNPFDAQRVTRALEVLEASGRSLLHWQGLPGTPVLDPGAVLPVVLRPARDALHRATDRRLIAMVAEGALDEVRRLIERRLDDGLPIMRALGVAPFIAHCQGAIDLDEAIARAQAETRQYVKRQETWLRRNMSAWKSFVAQENGSSYAQIIDFIRR